MPVHCAKLKIYDRYHSTLAPAHLSQLQLRLSSPSTYQSQPQQTSETNALTTSTHILLLRNPRHHPLTINRTLQVA
jgi:hypothetical protein